MAEHPAVKVTVVRFVENKEGVEKAGFILQPSPTKSVEVRYSFSTAKMNPEKEKVSTFKYIFFIFLPLTVILCSLPN